MALKNAWSHKYTLQIYFKKSYVRKMASFKTPLVSTPKHMLIEKYDTEERYP